MFQSFKFSHKLKNAFHQPKCWSTSWMTKSHSCGRLTSEDLGKRVTVAGWLQFKRKGEKLLNTLEKFLVLRDTHGLVQLMISNNSIWSKLGDISLESVLQVTGVVVRRPENQVNPNMTSGEIEIEVDSVDWVNPAPKNIPFYIKDFNEGKEPLRMQYRYLDIRRPSLQSNIKLRSDVVMKMRNFLTQNEFVDVETPTLFKRTPGGAREFVVPTRNENKYYTLVQSPQQFKQLLMVGGLERYFQIAKCYRDEGARPDRQPEFTQVDIELSFTHREGIIDLIERLLNASWPNHLPEIQRPFKKITYKECMDDYGCDKPDLRITSKIQDVTSLFKETSSFLTKLILEQNFKVKVIKFLAEDFKTYPSQSYLNKQLPDFLSKKKSNQSASLIVCALTQTPEGLMQNSVLKKVSEETRKDLERKILLNQGDVAILAAGSDEIVAESLSRVRTEFGANYLNVNPLDFRFLWVEDFPLFLPTEDGIECAHHPFTSPHPDDEELIFSDPLKVRGLHYDLVLNGFEIGGGSIRIHNWKLQEYILKDILNEDPAPLSHLLEALKFGCPPHGGIALGLDRLMAIICQSKSIRDVIAFPKTGDGKDLMANAPSEIRQVDKDFYHLK